MTKQQLIESVVVKTELGKAEAALAVDSVLDQIAESLQGNERVDLRGFGSFAIKERKERQGRNPRTGETITIAAKRAVSFKPSKELAVNWPRRDGSNTDALIHGASVEVRARLRLGSMFVWRCRLAG